MSVRRLSPNQPDSFTLSAKNRTWAKALIAKYPAGKQRSAVIPLLWRVQEQNEGWVSEAALRTVADMLDMAYIRVYEIATFYTMFQLSPVGKKAHIQVCGTTPCMLRGSEDLINICKNKISEKPHTLSADRDFSWEEVECLGACVNAPMIQIFKDTYEDLKPEAFDDLIECFKRGEQPKPGPQVDRQSSAPQAGITSLGHQGDESTGGGKLVKPSDASKVAKLEKKVSVEASSTPQAKETNVKPASASKRKKSPLAKAKSLLKKPRAARGKAKTVKALVSAEDKPLGLTKAKGKADDLKQIKGIGPKIESILNELGIFHFEQVANWTPKNIAWVNDHISFRGRIEREQWIKQANTLAKGEETEFSKRVAKGKVPSSNSD